MTSRNVWSTQELSQIISALETTVEEGAPQTQDREAQAFQRGYKTALLTLRMGIGAPMPELPSRERVR